MNENWFKTFQLGTLVTKKSGSSWTGRVVGFYSTELTPEGYAVESETETGSVQIRTTDLTTRRTDDSAGTSSDRHRATGITRCRPVTYD